MFIAGYTISYAMLLKFFHLCGLADSHWQLNALLFLADDDHTCRDCARCEELCALVISLDEVERVDELDHCSLEFEDSKTVADTASVAANEGQER